MYWVRLKGFYVFARFSANFSENGSEADSGRQQREIQNHSSLLVQLSRCTFLVDKKWTIRSGVQHSSLLKGKLLSALGDYNSCLTDYCLT